jgi:hypothetical protein
MWLRHWSGLKASSALPMALQRPSMVRRAAVRSSAFSLAKNGSIGFRSGLAGRQEEQARTDSLDRLAHPFHLVAAEGVPLRVAFGSITTVSPGRRLGARNCSTSVRKLMPLIAPSSTTGATTRSARRPAMKLSVFQ